MATKVIFLYLDGFIKIIIWTLSRERVYGAIGCPGSINQIAVWNFIKLIWAYKSEIQISANTLFSIISDNAFVYTCSSMVEFYEESNL